MIKDITCIECPNGCKLTVEVKDGFMVKVSGQKCEKGEKYAKTEIENPVRVITSTVLTEGLALKMVPVKTEGPIPKEKIFEAIEEIKKVKLTEPVEMGGVVVNDLCEMGVKLIATRSCQ